MEVVDSIYLFINLITYLLKLHELNETLMSYPKTVRPHENVFLRHKNLIILSV